MNPVPAKKADRMLTECGRKTPSPLKSRQDVGGKHRPHQKSRQDVGVTPHPANENNGWWIRMLNDDDADEDNAFFISRANLVQTRSNCCNLGILKNWAVVATTPGAHIGGGVPRRSCCNHGRAALKMGQLLQPPRRLIRSAPRRS